MIKYIITLIVTQLAFIFCTYSQPKLLKTFDKIQINEEYSLLVQNHPVTVVLQQKVN